MSFILDALKKSERERQRKNTPKISDVLMESENKKNNKHNLVIIFLLLSIILLLIYSQFYSTSRISNIEKKPIIELPQSTKSNTLDIKNNTKEKEIDLYQQDVKIPDPNKANEVPDILDISVANVSHNLFLPEMHIDIHVFSEIPSERFVFINMKKYFEGEELQEGILVETITAEGVLLKQQDITFLLPKN
jgi:LAS superfamily LD-carboxypeptidase LdcB